jgi:hypothetical protein
MDLTSILILVFGFIVLLALGYYLYMKKNLVYIISLSVFYMALVFFILSKQPQSGGSFLDIIYTLFAVFSIFFGMIVTLIIFVIKSKKDKE